MINSIIDIYTDGSCLKNPGPGGIGYLIRYQLEEDDTKDYKEIEYAKAYRYTTNNRMELLAAISAINYIIDKVNNDDEWKNVQQIHLSSDSEYLCKTINLKWLENWLENNWMTKGYGNTEPKEVKNKDLWQQFIEIQTKLRAMSIALIVSWVKGHADDQFNERVDKLARDIASSSDTSEVDKVYEELIREKKRYY